MRFQLPKKVGQWTFTKINENLVVFKKHKTHLEVFINGVPVFYYSGNPPKEQVQKDLERKLQIQ
jgi:EAL domain-containing protein (putative c-di-GMP-specific phosphodiesterase class I)